MEESGFVEIGGDMVAVEEGVSGWIGREDADEPVEERDDVLVSVGKRGGAGGSSYASPLYASSSSSSAVCERGEDTNEGERDPSRRACEEIEVCLVLLRGGLMFGDVEGDLLSSDKTSVCTRSGWNECSENMSRSGAALLPLAPRVSDPVGNSFGVGGWSVRTGVVLTGDGDRGGDGGSGDAAFLIEYMDDLGV